MIDDEGREAAAVLREVLARECARVDDPGAGIPGADPDDGHGWHPWSPDQPAQPRRPGVPVFHPECWRYFRLLDLGWLQDTLLVSFAWDELGTPNLTYTTPVQFHPDLRAHGARALALTARGHLRWLLAPNDLAVRLSPNPAATPLDPGQALARTLRTALARTRTRARVPGRCTRPARPRPALAAGLALADRPRPVGRRGCRGQEARHGFAGRVVSEPVAGVE